VKTRLRCSSCSFLTGPARDLLLELGLHWARLPSPTHRTILQPAHRTGAATNQSQFHRVISQREISRTLYGALPSTVLCSSNTQQFGLYLEYTSQKQTTKYSNRVLILARAER